MSDDEMTGSGPVTVIEAPKDTGGSISVSEAARILSNARPKPPEEAPAPAVEPAQVSAPEAEAAPLQASGEPEAVEAETPIDPPQFWTKEAKERWADLPRDTQEYLVERESERMREVDKRLNEAAEKAKDYQSKAEKAEQVRQQYEAALPLLMQQQAEHFSAEFPDVKSPHDLERLAREDPARYLLADLKLKSIQGTQQRLIEAQQRQSQAQSEGFQTFASEQDKLFAEKIPPTEAKDLQNRAVEYLKDIGFTDDELSREWGSNKLFRDHRMQLLIRDAVRHRADKAAGEAAKKALAAKAKPVPPVLRPGAAPPRGADKSQQIAALQAQLANAVGRRAIDLGTQLYELQRSA